MDPGSDFSPHNNMVACSACGALGIAIEGVQYLLMASPLFGSGRLVRLIVQIDDGVVIPCGQNETYILESALNGFFVGSPCSRVGDAGGRSCPRRIWNFVLI